MPSNHPILCRPLHEPEQAPGDGEGQRSLACCSPWDHKELDRIKGLNNKNNMYGCESWTIKKAECLLSAEELMHLNYGVAEDS